MISGVGAKGMSRSARPSCAVGSTSGPEPPRAAALCSPAAADGADDEPVHARRVIVHHPSPSRGRRRTRSREPSRSSRRRSWRRRAPRDPEGPSGDAAPGAREAAPRRGKTSTTGLLSPRSSALFVSFSSLALRAISAAARSTSSFGEHEHVPLALAPVPSSAVSIADRSSSRAAPSRAHTGCCRPGTRRTGAPPRYSARRSTSSIVAEVTTSGERRRAGRGRPGLGPRAPGAPAPALAPRRLSLSRRRFA